MGITSRDFYRHITPFGSKVSPCDARRQTSVARDTVTPFPSILQHETAIRPEPFQSSLFAMGVALMRSRKSVEVQVENEIREDVVAVRCPESAQEEESFAVDLGAPELKDVLEESVPVVFKGSRSERRKHYHIRSGERRTRGMRRRKCYYYDSPPSKDFVDLVHYEKPAPKQKPAPFREGSIIVTESSCKRRDRTRTSISKTASKESHGSTLHQQLVTYESVLGGITKYKELRTPPANIPSYDEKYRSPPRRYRSDPRSDGNPQYISGAAGTADDNAEDEEKEVIEIQEDRIVSPLGQPVRVRQRIVEVHIFEFHDCGVASHKHYSSYAATNCARGNPPKWLAVDHGS